MQRNVFSFGERVVPTWLPEPRRRWFRRPAPPGKRTDVFLDFLVDGRPLQEVLEVDDDVRAPTDEVTDLGESMVEEALLQVDRLLGVEPSQYGSERVWLLFCPVCHEESVSAMVEQKDDVVIWFDFAWDGVVPGPPMPLAGSSQRFAFDAAAYESALLAVRARFAAKA